MGLLDGRRILLGLGGGISAYKGPELVRRLRDAGADVHVVMTAAATHFVSALALEIVSEHPVGLDLWRADGASRIVHTDLGKSADLIILAPATADLIAKIRHGLADDLLTTTLMACRTPVLACPAMNTEMLLNPQVAANLDALRATPRFHLLEPGVGLLACGISGPGRQPDPPDIIEAAAAALTPQDLSGLSALVSAGPTHEPLDPVRYLANRSSGTMGFALARALAARGAAVTLVAGPVSLRTPVGVQQRIDVETAAEMLAALERAFPAHAFLAMSAAVADYRPSAPSTTKLKRREATQAPTLALTNNPDILATLARHPTRQGRKLLGFAAETHNVLSYARAKLVEKDLDWIFANDVSAAGSGFGAGDNAGHLLGRDDSCTAFPRATKDALADALVAHLAPALAELRTP